MWNHWFWMIENWWELYRKYRISCIYLCHCETYPHWMILLPQSHLMDVLICSKSEYKNNVSEYSSLETYLLPSSCFVCSSGRHRQGRWWRVWGNLLPLSGSLASTINPSLEMYSHTHLRKDKIQTKWIINNIMINIYNFMKCQMMRKFFTLSSPLFIISANANRCKNMISLSAWTTV